MHKLQISTITELSRNTVRKHLTLFTELETSWDALSRLSDKELHEFFRLEPIVQLDDRTQKLYEFLKENDKKLSQRGMTLGRLYSHYARDVSDGYHTSAFYKYYRLWKRWAPPSMRIVHIAGDKMYVDYTGVKLQAVDVSTGGGGHRNQILRLADCGFIGRKENIHITGSTGTGKSYIASAIGHEACSAGYKVLYEHSAKLFSRLKLAKADGSYLKELVRMEKQQLLIFDDFGMQPLDAQSRAILMEISEDRHGKRSTLFTSQVPVSNWYEVIGEQTIADAIVDRIIHDAHRLELKGESMRKRRETLPTETTRTTR